MITRRRHLQLATAFFGTTTLGPGAFAGTASATGNAGFRMPEESEPHLRTFMQWPVSRTVHPDPVFLGMLQQSIADIANTIVAFEPVVMLMDRRYEKPARRKLSAEVEIWNIATDDLWCRDAGPVFVTNDTGDLAITRMNFNGWGDKQAHENDGRIADRVAKKLGIPVFNNGLIGEAGGVESDGYGTLIAHESSWVNPNRNAGKRAEVEALLLNALGAEKMIWAPGVAGADITDYHIDSLARFTKPGEVLIQMSDKVDPRDPWSKAAWETYERLKGATDARGNTLDLVVLPEPYKPGSHRRISSHPM